MSATVPAPKRIALLVLDVVKSSGSSRPRERVRPNQTLIAGRRDVQVLGVRQVGEEAERRAARAPRRSTRSRTSVPAARRRTRSRSRSRSATSPPAHSFRPSAISAACQQQQRRRRSARSARGSGRPRRRWLPSNRRGCCTLRIANAATTPTSTSTAKRSTSSANQPCCPSHGSVAPRRRPPISAITIVGNEHEEAPEDERVDEAGDEALEQLPLAERRRPPRCARAWARRRSAAIGFPSRTSRYSSSARRANSAGRRRRARRGEHDARRSSVEAASHARRISAEIAGTTSCRSPITA